VRRGQATAIAPHPSQKLQAGSFFSGARFTHRAVLLLEVTLKALC